MSDFIIDGSFEIANTKNYILSIQVCLDGFSFLMADPEKNQNVALKYVPLKISNESLIARHLKEWIESEDLLKNQFKTVRAYIYTDNFSLIPGPYFGRERLRNLTSVLFDKKSSNNFVETQIESINATLFFPVPPDISSILNQFFGLGYEIIHPVYSLIQKGIERNNTNLALLLSTKKYFYLVVFDNGGLKLANVYQTQHQNDLVYNAINSLQQLGAVRGETGLYIVSAIEGSNEIEILLKPYFENITTLRIEGLI
jgi:hypothetical protein